MLVGVVGTAITLYAKGYRVWVVHTGSMEPTYVPGDLIVDRPPSGQYHPGEVITFRHSSLTTDVVTHRVTVVREDGLINTKGDANRTADVWNIRPDQVQGSVQFRLKGVGYLVAFLKQPTGIWAIGSLAVGLVLLWQLFFPPTDTGAAPQKRRPGAQPATV